MFYAIAGLMLVLWVIGIATSQTLGGYIHLLLVFSILTVLASLVYGEKRS